MASCVVALLMVAFHEYTTATLPLTGFMQTAVHLVLAICVISLSMISRNESETITLQDILAIVMISLALIFNVRILVTGGLISAKLTANISTSDMVIAMFAVVAVLMATRCSIGMAMVWVSAVFIAYAFLGPWLPGVLSHNGIRLKRLLSVIYLTNEGIYGSPLKISASEIFPLMIYGGIMVGLGGDELLMGVSQRALGVYRGGIAKVSVLASALFGMISGAGPANAATTGTFTIPMMKKYGYSANFAGATVATASIGGQIMPPIMGASAFIMAEYLGVSYGSLILYAAPPAILYYVAVFMAVDIEAQKRNLTGLPRAEMPPIAPVVKEHWHFLISIVVLVVLLTFFGYGPGAAGFWATATMAASETIYCLVKKKKLDFKELALYIVECVRNASSIAVSCACAGIILSVVDRSGLAIKMTSLMLALSGGKIFVMLIMAAVASLIMGMALPTVACFIVVATMVAPSLIEAGVNPYSAYFFAFYFGMVSNITPPVALTAYVAAGIAETSPIKTAVTATKIGMAAYVLPFLFVYDPGLLLQGSLSDMLYGCVKAIFVIFTAAVVFGGTWFCVKIPYWMRVLMTGAAICIFLPFRTLDILSVVVIVFCFVLHYAHTKKVKTQPRSA
jgi:TRAP transporter 4TM/12TM fusion protein